MNDSAVDRSVDRYAVVGYPIQHSWSPFIHGLFAKQTNQAMSYTRMAVTPENFERDVGAPKVSFTRRTISR